MGKGFLWEMWEDLLYVNSIGYLHTKIAIGYIQLNNVQNLRLSRNHFYRKATEVPSAHNEKSNVRSSQGCSLRNVAMGGHPSAVWRPNGTCGVRTEDGRHRSARKTSLCAVYCAESCGRLD